MKIVSGKTATLMATTGLIAVLGTAGVQAGTYIGEFCWDLVFTVPEGRTALVRAAVTDMGNGHFFLNGKATSNEGRVIAVHGNAERDGNQIRITGVGAGSDATKTWGHTGNWLLDATTLSGTLSRVGTLFDSESATFTDYYNVGTTTFTACPQ